MTTRKVIYYSFFLAALLWAFILWIGRHNTDGQELFFITFFVFIAWGIGLFLGVGLAVVIKKPEAEPYFYLSGQLSVVLAVVVFVIDARYNDGKNHHDFGNIEDNHSFVNLEKSSYEDYRPDYIRTAFLKLESGFADPNSFHLEKYFSCWRDTLVNSSSDTVHTVYFAYLKGQNMFFAKVTVFRDSATINSLDAATRSDQDSHLKNFGAWGRRGDLEDVKKALRDLPDSTRNKVIDLLSD